LRSKEWLCGGLKHNASMWRSDGNIT